MQIVFYIGGSKLENYLKDFAEGYELMYRLTDPSVFTTYRRWYKTTYNKYDHATYMENLMCINLDKFMKKFVRLNKHQKVQSLLKYIEYNQQEYTYIYSAKIKVDYFQLFCDFSQYDIIVRYIDEKDIYPLQGFNVKFERVNEDGTTCDSI